MSSTNPPSSLTFTTASEAKAKEDELRNEGASFKTQIVKTRRRGLEYRIDLFNVA